MENTKTHIDKLIFRIFAIWKKSVISVKKF